MAVIVTGNDCTWAETSVAWDSATGYWEDAIPLDAIGRASEVTSASGHRTIAVPKETRTVTVRKEG